MLCITLSNLQIHIFWNRDKTFHFCLKILHLKTFWDRYVNPSQGFKIFSIFKADKKCEINFKIFRVHIYHAMLQRFFFAHYVIHFISTNK